MAKLRIIDFLSKEEIEALENDTTMRDSIIITGGHESETIEESKEEKKTCPIRKSIK